MLKVGQEFMFKNKKYKVSGIRGKCLDLYREQVKGNKYLPYEEAILKLTHHMIMGRKIGFNKEGYPMFAYGNLILSYDKGSNRIIYLKNHKGECMYPLCINKKESEKLKKILWENYSFIDKIKMKFNNLKKVAVF